MLDDFDVNVWDRLYYMSDGEHCGDWVLDVYGLKEDQYGRPTTDSSNYRGRVFLRDSDVEALGLTVEEPDFWFTVSALLEQDGVPRRVRRLLGEVVVDGRASVA